MRFYFDCRAGPESRLSSRSPVLRAPEDAILRGYLIFRRQYTSALLEGQPVLENILLEAEGGPLSPPTGSSDNVAIFPPLENSQVLLSGKPFLKFGRSNESITDR